MSTAAIHLSNWILHHFPYPTEVTHLKLQKLAFYCFGACLAENLEDELGAGMVFEPWEHGPVNREIWQVHKGSRSKLNADLSLVPDYSAKLTQVLGNTLEVYGVLNAWQLREQSHLEEPWKSAFQQRAQLIDNRALKAHFQRKFSPNQVTAPEYLCDASGLSIDGIQLQKHASLAELATYIRAAKRVAREFVQEVS